MRQGARNNSSASRTGSESSKKLRLQRPPAQHLHRSAWPRGKSAFASFSAQIRLCGSALAVRVLLRTPTAPPLGVCGILEPRLLFRPYTSSSEPLTPMFAHISSVTSCSTAASCPSTSSSKPSPQCSPTSPASIPHVLQHSPSRPSTSPSGFPHLNVRPPFPAVLRHSQRLLSEPFTSNILAYPRLAARSGSPTAPPSLHIHRSVTGHPRQ